MKETAIATPGQSHITIKLKTSDVSDTATGAIRKVFYERFRVYITQIRRVQTIIVLWLTNI